MNELEFIRLESKPLCGTIGCQHTASFICWTRNFSSEHDEIEGLLVMRPLLMCKSCLRKIGGQV